MTDVVSPIPMMRITPSRHDQPAMTAADGNGGHFAAALNSALESAVQTGHQAEAASMKAIVEGGNVTEVATALSQAELVLSTATAIRDRMIQAYQEILRTQM